MTIINSHYVLRYTCIKINRLNKNELQFAIPRLKKKFNKTVDTLKKQYILIYIKKDINQSLSRFQGKKEGKGR